eukprot:TRINITY_DN2818_c0_g2_i1.p1 TRINITY_DN2818_c0_g2~~TRINITY_DN2818_c0_g2_i1.p1  ORF type:complete len:139 (-),score=40.21 TRINITY_DN2818_c0_g2_i1:50-412(-)
MTDIENELKILNSKKDSFECLSFACVEGISLYSELEDENLYNFLDAIYKNGFSKMKEDEMVAFVDGLTETQSTDALMKYTYELLKYVEYRDYSPWPMLKMHKVLFAKKNIGGIIRYLTNV